MRLILRYTIFSLLSVLFLMPAFVSAQTDPGSARSKPTTQQTPSPRTNQENKTKLGNGSKPDDKTKTEDEVTIVFPEVENWQRGEKRTYSSPELGYSVSYTSEEGGTVSVFVYNGGNSSIANGTTDEVVIEEFDRTKARMKMLGGQAAVEVKSDTVTLGGTSGKVSALRALYNFSLQNQTVDSEIFIFGYKNNFIKIMATRPKSKNGENKSLIKLLAAIDKMFAK